MHCKRKLKAPIVWHMQSSTVGDVAARVTTTRCTSPGVRTDRT